MSKTLYEHYNDRAWSDNQTMPYDTWASVWLSTFFSAWLRSGRPWANLGAGLNDIQQIKDGQVELDYFLENWRLK